MSLTSKLRYGIYGGTFDPFHLGHRRCVELAHDELGLDAIIVCPSNASERQWGKCHGANPQQRLEMCRLGLGGLPYALVSDVDIARGGCTYSIDTVGELKARYPDVAEWVFIGGTDAMASVPRWVRARDLAGEVGFAIIERAGCALDAARQDDMRELGMRVSRLTADVPDVSSTRIRQAIAKGEDVRECVPDAVFEYLRESGMYKNADAMVHGEGEPSDG